MEKKVRAMAYVLRVAVLAVILISMSILMVGCGQESAAESGGTTTVNANTPPLLQISNPGSSNGTEASAVTSTGNVNSAPARYWIPYGIWLEWLDGDTFGAIDALTGEVIFELPDGWYPMSMIFADGLAIVVSQEANNQYHIHLIDTNGQVIITIDISAGEFYMTPFHDGIAFIVTLYGDEYALGFIDTTGNITQSPEWGGLGQFSEDLAMVQMIDSGLWGFIDRSGNIVIEPQWSDARAFNSGLARVRCIDNGWGFIDTDGNIVSGPQWDSMRFDLSALSHILRLDYTGFDGMDAGDSYVSTAAAHEGAT